MDEPLARDSDQSAVSVAPGFLDPLDPNDRIPPLSLCIDRAGVHFDASRPSDLEALLATDPLDDTALLDRARRGIEAIASNHLGQSARRDAGIDPPAPGYVLVIDQAPDDPALMGADAALFREMLVAAAVENPANPVLVIRDPRAAEKRTVADADGVDRVELFETQASFWRLFEGAVGVYTHSSLVGFDAIFASHRPRVFGQPFYAGWGLTDDRNPVARRERTLSRAQLFAGAMILYPKYFDLDADRECGFEDALDLSIRRRAKSRRGVRAALKVITGGLRGAGKP